MSDVWVYQGKELRVLRRDSLKSLPDDIEALKAALSLLARRLRLPAPGNPTTRH